MNEDDKAGFLDRTLNNLRNAWQAIAGSAYDESTASLRPDLPEADTAALLKQMRACLDSRGGEVSARARAAALGRAYLALDATGRERFLDLLASEFDVDHAAVDRAVDALRGARGDAAREAAENALRAALAPPRIELATRFNALPEGVKFLVDMRAELMRIAGPNLRLRALERDLKSLLTTWFDVDFLELRRITWESASAAVLEKLIAYEAVHAIRDWDDLKDRLDSDRRCFAFFHPRMPDEPLIFVEVALVHGMADDIQTLLDETTPVEDAARADTAVFYSISNAQSGLDGINLGNFLIKRVVDELTREFEGLTTFATLSPIPGFRAWLDKRLANGADELLRPGEDEDHPRGRRGRQRCPCRAEIINRESRLARGQGGRAGAPQALEASLRALPDSRTPVRQLRARPRRAFPFAQRRAHGAIELAGRPVANRARAFGRHDA